MLSEFVTLFHRIIERESHLAYRNRTILSPTSSVIVVRELHSLTLVILRKGINHITLDIVIKEVSIATVYPISEPHHQQVVGQPVVAHIVPFLIFTPHISYEVHSGMSSVVEKNYRNFKCMLYKELRHSPA